MAEFTSLKQRDNSKLKGLENYQIHKCTDLFEPIYEHAHASTLVQLPDGELIVAWFQADGERRANGDGRILAVRKPYGENWCKPFTLINTPGHPDVNPAMFIDKNGRLWVFWYTVLSNQWKTSQVRYRYAEKGHYESACGYVGEPDWAWQDSIYVKPGDDFVGQAKSFDGISYSYPERGSEVRYISAKQFSQHPLNDPREYVKIKERYVTDSFAVAVRNGCEDAIDCLQRFYESHTLDEKLIKDAEKTLVSLACGIDNNWNPFWTRIGWQTKNKPFEICLSDGSNRLLVPLYSDHFGASLMAYSDNGQPWSYGRPTVGLGTIQAATVVKNDGTLRSYFRNGLQERYVVYYESSDCGLTWGKPMIERGLQHVGGFDIIRLTSGQWVMTITDSVKSEEHQVNRACLRLAVSHDEGQTWQFTLLEEDQSGLSQFHYSAIIQGYDNNIYISYSYDTPDKKNTIRLMELKSK